METAPELHPGTNLRNIRRTAEHVVTNAPNVVTNPESGRTVFCRNVVSLPSENLIVRTMESLVMKHTRVARWIDLLFCLVILPLAIMLLPVDRWIVNNTAFLITLVGYLYALYFTYRWAKLSQLFRQRRYLHIAGLMLVLVGITALLTHFPMPDNSAALDARQLAARRGIRTQTVWFFFLIVTGFSLAIELTFELFRQILARQELAAERDRAELALYKAQINPHFLFNTLNTLYALTLSKSDRAESAFVKFSNILHYMYAQADRELIPLCEEREYIRQYVDLQRLRLNAHTRIELTEKIDDERVLVPPMLFITFVENAFKYGSSSERDCSIRISLRLHDGILEFRTENAVMRPREHGCGIGIENCRKRLQLLFQGDFDLQTSENDGIYRVRLAIRLKPTRS